MRLTIEVEGKSRTVELPEQVVDAMWTIARRHDITLEQAIAQALVNQKYLEDEVADGGELQVKQGDRIRKLEYA